MLDLGQVRVRITVIDQGIEKFRRLPDRLQALVEAEVLLLFLENIGNCLMLVVEPVELCNAWCRRSIVDAELGLGLPFPVKAAHEFIPLLQLGKRLLLGKRGAHWNLLKPACKKYLPSATLTKDA